MNRFTRACLIAAGLTIATSAAAVAQPTEWDNYAGLMLQSAFGNVTSQAFGVEAGVPVTSSIEVFLEGGRTFDAAPESTGKAAQLIAATLGQTQSNVGYSVTVPIDFFDVGARYRLPITGKLQPYVLAGGGIGRVKPDVTFTIGGATVNNRLDQFGIVLGTDLSGTTTKAMMVAGAGGLYPISDRFYADLEFRYNRVFISGGAIPFSRLGLGFGVRF
jgi:opacity protein-like surface antigen